MVAPAQETWLARWTRRALILGALALAVLSISFPAHAGTHVVRATTIAGMLGLVEWNTAPPRVAVPVRDASRVNR